LGVTCFSRARARARCFESAEGKRKREWERVSAERLLVAIPVTMCDRCVVWRHSSLSFLSLFCLFSLSRRDFQSIWILASSLFFFPFSLSLHLSLIYVYIK
jgi:hypothetical protein